MSLPELHETGLYDARELRALCGGAPGARVAIYLPLAPLPPASQNALRARHAVHEAIKKLEALGVAEPALAHWRERLDDAVQALEGLRDPRGSIVLLADEGNLQLARVAAELPVAVRVGHRLALRPLLRALALERRYRVLALSAKRVALYEGDAHGLAPIPLGAIPASLEDALGSEKTEKQPRMRGTREGGGAPVHYAHDTASEERKLDAERFRHALALAVNARFGADPTLLVLAADGQHVAALRAALHVPGLAPDAVALSPDAQSASDLHAKAWPLVISALLARDAEASGSFERARNAGKGADLPDDVAQAAATGRVHRLWLDAEATSPGCIDAETGRIRDGAGDDDVLDDLAALVVRHGGEVRVVPTAAMPTRTAAAAELR